MTGRKKRAFTIVIMVLTLGMSACGKNTSVVDEIAGQQYGTEEQNPANGKGSPNGLEEVTEGSESIAGGTAAEAGTGKDTTGDGTNKKGNAEVEGSKDSSGIDVDLTKLSSNMVYAEVYNMMTSPEDYVGKTIKMEGTYYASYWEGTGKYYHCVLISDAAACCQNGIEFVWDDDTHVYPDEYPPDNTVIELTGVFELYEEEGQTYCHIKTDDIIIP